MKRRWKGLCALWMVLVLMVGASPVTVAAEDVPGTIAAETDSGVEPREGQTQEESSEEETSSEEESETETSEIEESETESLETKESETESSETEETESKESVTEEAETPPEEVSEGTSKSSAEEDENGETLEESAESEKTTEGIEKETSGEISTEEGTSTEEIVSEETDEGNGEFSDKSLEALDADGIMLMEGETTVAGGSTSVSAYLYTGGDNITPGDSVNINTGWEYAEVQFNVSFDNQDSLNSIVDEITPDGKELKGWNVWKGYYNSGDVELADNNVNEISADGQIAYSEYQSFIENAGEKTPFLLVIPQWADITIVDVTIENGVPINLKINVKYTLPSGTWQVTGDPTIYNGGQDFYIIRDGKFTFTQKE